MRSICDDLEAEHGELDDLVADLDDAHWDIDTPSPGWTVRDQISHLWFFDQRAVLALTDADAFFADTQWLASHGGTDASIVPGRSIPSTDLLHHWRAERQELIDIAVALDPTSRVQWYGPPMGARSFITARLMETWAHGQDVADALGVVRRPTARLRHVAHIGVRARPFSYAIHGMTVPEGDVAVHLVAPDGEHWDWGESTTDSVSGPALDFCLVATQRRHLADTTLRVVGDSAAEWVSIAQAFAGGVGAGRDPGQFTVTDR